MSSKEINHEPLRGLEPHTSLVCSHDFQEPSILSALKKIHQEPKESIAKENISSKGLMLPYLHGYITKESLFEIYFPEKLKYEDHD